MISLQTLTTIEALLMSRSDPRWGEFMVLAGTIAEVQQAKQAMMQSRVQLASAANNAQQSAGAALGSVPNGAALPTGDAA